MSFATRTTWKLRWRRRSMLGPHAMIGFLVLLQRTPSTSLFSLLGTVATATFQAGSSGEVTFVLYPLILQLTRILGISWKTACGCGLYTPDWWLDVMLHHLVRLLVLHDGFLRHQASNHDHWEPVTILGECDSDPWPKSRNLLPATSSCARRCFWCCWRMLLAAPLRWNILKGKKKGQRNGAFGIVPLLHSSSLTRTLVAWYFCKGLLADHFPSQLLCWLDASVAWQVKFLQHMTPSGAPRRPWVGSEANTGPPELQRNILYDCARSWPRPTCSTPRSSQLIDLEVAAPKDLQGALDALCGLFGPYLTSAKGSVMQNDYSGPRST